MKKLSRPFRRPSSPLLFPYRVGINPMYFFFCFSLADRPTVNIMSGPMNISRGIPENSGSKIQFKSLRYVDGVNQIFRKIIVFKSFNIPFSFRKNVYGVLALRFFSLFEVQNGVILHKRQFIIKRHRYSCTGSYF